MGAKYVLVVDDDPNQRESIAEILESKGYRVTTTGNGWQALELAATSPPAIILLDLSMPVMTGWVVINRLKSDSTLRDIPILVISDEVDLPQNVIALLKPVRIEQMLGLIECVLEGGTQSARAKGFTDSSDQATAKALGTRE